MKHCAWPVTECELAISLVEGRERGLCFYHDKCVRGMFSVPPRRLGPRVLASDVLSDEQREIMALLIVLGMEQSRARAHALAKRK